MPSHEPGLLASVPGSPARPSPGPGERPATPPWLARAGRWAVHVLALSTAYIPFAICLFGGAATTSLWLDEIFYRYLELDRGLRAHEIGRHGSLFAAVLEKDVYCDFRLAFGALLDWTHVSPLLGVEASLRLPALLGFLGSTLLVYVVVLRSTRSLAAAATAASLFATLPALLQYAFEARCYSPNALVALGFVVTVAAARTSRGAAVWAAVLGLVAVLFHWWAVCIPSAVILLASVEALRSRRLEAGTGRLLAASMPGVLLAGVQALYLAAVPGAGEAAFPLFRARGLAVAFRSTIAAPWLDLWGRPVHVRLLALGGVLVLLVLSWRRHGGAGDPLLRRVGPVALAGGAIAGAYLGNIVFSRHLVPHLAVTVLGLGLAQGRAALLTRLALVALNTGFLSHTYAVVTHKGNGRVLAEIVSARGDDPARTGIVVQQGLVLGYPDPVNSFGLDFYLNGLGAGPRVPLYELPALQDITGRRGLFEYFSGGDELLNRYASRPVERWDAWLRRSGRPILWFVAPMARIPAEAAQQGEFRQALLRAGYRSSPGAAYFLRAYPATALERFERTADP